MKKFNKEGSFGRKFERRDNDRNFSKNSDRFSRRPEMFQATCDKCGSECEVPFKPSNDKPIYCNDCFRNKEKDHEHRFKRKSNEASNLSSPSLVEINQKLDKIMKALRID